MDCHISQIGAARLRLEGVDAETRALLDKKLSFETPGFQFTPAGRRWRNSGGKWGWDGRTHLFHAESGAFPIGLLDRVVALVKSNGYEPKVGLNPTPTVEIVPSERAGTVPRRKVASRLPDRSRPRKREGEAPGRSEVARDILPGVTLYDHQAEAATAILTRKRGIIWISTGGGKTELAIAVSKHLIENKLITGRVLFLSGRKKLLRDTKARFEKHLGHEVGFLAEGKEDIEPQIVVASVDTLRRRLKLLAKWRKTVEVLFVDEAHHLAAASWMKVAMAFPAHYRIGLSGTPLDRGDGKNLMVIAATGEVIYEARSGALAAKNLLATTDVEMITCRTPEDMSDLEWDFVYTAGITTNAWRNARIAEEAIERSKLGPVLVLSQEILHGSQIQLGLLAKGVKVRFVHGSTESKVIDLAVEELNEGVRKILIASPIFREGVDIPKIRTVIIADAGKSIIKILQQVGRGIRKKAGENRLTVIDFADMQSPYLSRHSLARLETFKREGWPVRHIA